MDTRIFIHRIDSLDQISTVNNNWIAFAKENEDPALADKVIGSSIWDYIFGDETKHIFAILFRKVRGDERIITVPFRCDSPALRRFMEMQLIPRPKQEIDFQSHIVRVEKRKPVSLLALHTKRSDDVIVMCSWCKRVKLDTWVEVEDAVRDLRLFEKTAMPGITHGICGDCNEKFLAAIKS